jgi:uncharacterized protein (DUF2252 family)
MYISHFFFELRIGSDLSTNLEFEFPHAFLKSKQMLQNANKKTEYSRTADELNNQQINSQYSYAERREMGKKLRDVCPRTSHATWKPPEGRPDPVSLVEKADKGRVPELLALRHGRMAKSAFTFYRGGALNMATDLANTPVSGIRVQCCGDAHLCNFGGFATPERQIIFSINDLDETLPAPWEWDIKRLAASFMVASRDNGFSKADAKDTVLTCVRSYREWMSEFSMMKTLERWHFALYSDMLISGIKDPDVRRMLIKRLSKESGKSVTDDLYPKLVNSKGGSEFIKDQPPTIFHWKDHKPGEVDDFVINSYNNYQKSLVPAYSNLLNNYQLKDAALKVVGVGSVGTACWVLLLTANNANKDPLFLQVKEARASVLEPFAGKSRFENDGERIVNGYRSMQPYSDILLGWTTGEMESRHYFVRQLRDIKISARVETFSPAVMDIYASWCGWALALSHSRSGDSAMISGYLGKSDTFDKAIAAFSVSYADQNEQDHNSIIRAIRNGKLEAVSE